MLPPQSENEFPCIGAENGLSLIVCLDLCSAAPAKFAVLIDLFPALDAECRRMRLLHGNICSHHIEPACKALRLIILISEVLPFDLSRMQSIFCFVNGFIANKSDNDKHHESYSEYSKIKHCRLLKKTVMHLEIKVVCFDTRVRIKVQEDLFNRGHEHIHHFAVNVTVVRRFPVSELKAEDTYT